MSHGSQVRLALVNGMRRGPSVGCYEDIAERLRALGLHVDLMHGLRGQALPLQGYDLVVGNRDLPVSVRPNIPTYTGRAVSRPISLNWIEKSGVPTMEWALARTRFHVWALFGTWSVDRLLLKPSYTFGGKGVCVFSRSAVWKLRWKRDDDVFCREVNPDDGDVYKAELFNGHILIAWKSAAPPIKDHFKRGIHLGLRGAYGERSLWTLPPDLAAKLEGLGRDLMAEGLGHVSVDLMRRPDGEFVAIELNPRSIATWWTKQFPEFRERYAAAIYELAMLHR